MARLARALSLLEAAASRLFPTPFPHLPDPQRGVGPCESVEPLDSEENEGVSREALEPSANRRGCLLLCRATQGPSL